MRKHEAAVARPGRPAFVAVERRHFSRRTTGRWRDIQIERPAGVRRNAMDFPSGDHDGSRSLTHWPPAVYRLFVAPVRRHGPYGFEP